MSLLRVLFVEDSENDAYLLRRELERSDYELDSDRVDSLAAMDAALDRQEWDLIIADYLMPRFSGLAALELLKRRGMDVPFILVSGAIREDTAVEAMKSGAHDFIMKTNLARLVPAVRRELNEAANRRARAMAERDAGESHRRLKRANHDLQLLLQAVSHDLKEPLRAIESFSAILLERFSRKVDETDRDYLNRLMRASRRMRKLLDNIMTLSQIQYIEPKPQEIEATPLVHEAIRQLEDAIRRTRAAITINGPLPKLNTESTWAIRAVYNLLSNALKFAGPAPPRIEIGPYVGNANGSTRTGLAIRDQGPGIEPGLEDKIFDLFKRGVGRDIEGTGAGLAIVRRVAERYGGSAWVTPRPGGGSEFVVTFGAIGGDE